MNPLEEIINTLDDIEYKAKNNFELYNIKVIVPDDYVNEYGIKNRNSHHSRQIKFAEYLLVKTEELKKYLKVHIEKVVTEDRRMQSYLIRQYRKNEKLIKRLVLK